MFASIVRASEIVVLVFAPLFLNLGVLLAERSSRGGVAYDFNRAILPAARAVLHGSSPYGPATVAALRPGTAFVYPPIAAFVFAPFTLLPDQWAEYLLSVLVLLCAPAALRVLGVRDWRCYGASMLWSPVVYTVRLGALSLPLALLLALAWKYRGQTTGCIALAAAIALKLFLWPLLIWLIATRRIRSTSTVAAATTGLLLVPWAAIGFADFTEYPHMLRVLSSIEAPQGYTFAALFAKAGGSWNLGRLLTEVLGVALSIAAVRAGRRGDDRRSFSLALAVAFVISPIVWIHYFALLLVPVAVRRPTFGPLWLLPFALFACPTTPGAASAVQLGAALAIAAVTFLDVSDARLGPRASATRRDPQEVSPPPTGRRQHLPPTPFGRPQPCR